MTRKKKRDSPLNRKCHGGREDLAQRGIGDAGTRGEVGGRVGREVGSWGEGPEESGNMRTGRRGQMGVANEERAGQKGNGINDSQACSNPGLVLGVSIPVLVPVPIPLVDPDPIVNRSAAPQTTAGEVGAEEEGMI
ncbi:hypothetical protein C8J57DRAFT_1242159 [Mycena rebaudengoi]|nr:hypothetical protein C8J57DRAFT_1242159 [Mycena rebaudengoi]